MRGPLLLLAGIALYSLLDANNKLMSGAYGVGQAAVFRYGTLLLMLGAAALLLRGGLGTLRTDRPGMHLLRTSAMMVAIAGFYLGFQRLPLADGYLLFFTAPFMTLALAAVVLKERVPPAAWAWCGVGFAGVLLAMLPRLGIGGSLAGFGFVLAGTIAFSVTQTVNRVLRHEQGLARILVWPSIAGVVLYAPVMVRDWVTPDAMGVFQLCLAGVFAGGATLFTAMAFRSADAARLGPYNYVAFPIAVLLDLLVWGLRPEPLTLLGGAVVVAACLMSERARRRAVTGSPAGSGAARPVPGAGG